MSGSTIKILITVLIFVGFFSISYAGYHHGCGTMRISEMTEMDTDNDGFISFDEFSAPHMEQYRSAFDLLDTNKDGELSRDEYDAFRKMHGYDTNPEG